MPTKTQNNTDFLIIDFMLTSIFCQLTKFSNIGIWKPNFLDNFSHTNVKIAKSIMLWITETSITKGNDIGAALKVSHWMFITYGIMATIEKVLAASSVKYNFRFMVFLMLIRNFI